MLSAERIQEAEKNVRMYLIDNLMKKEQFEAMIFKTFMRNHRESLLVAKKLFDESLSPLWVVIISYYSMFYIANAAIYKIGFKIGSKVAHKVTADALIVYVRKKLKEHLLENYELASTEALVLCDTLLQGYDLERIKRSVFQYETTEEIKTGKAKTSLQRAEQFSNEMEKLIIRKNETT